MGQFTEQIEGLKRQLSSCPSSYTERRDSIIKNIKTLMELDGWVPGALEKRVSAAESDIESLFEIIESLPTELKKKIGFPSPE